MKFWGPSQIPYTPGMSLYARNPWDQKLKVILSCITSSRLEWAIEMLFFKKKERKKERREGGKEKDA